MSDSRTSENSGTGGCLLIVGGFIVIGIVIAVLVGLAALIDPFGWLPSIGTIYDCSDDCSLTERYPGFAWHVVANLAWTVAFAISLICQFAAASDMRDARPARFDSHEAEQTWRQARELTAGAAVVTGALAVTPLLVALI